MMNDIEHQNEHNRRANECGVADLPVQKEDSQPYL